ncbi:MAG: hypothetical protein IJF33_05095 [Clostridia bacterium]|nr:hypothetical protein [Clostridia bacterium]
MKSFFRRMGERFARMMYGRYGNDALNNFLLIVSLILLLLAYLPYMGVCLLLAVGIMIWSNVRCFSRNIGKRRRELMKYLSIRNRMKGFFTLRKKMWKERKTHCYFKCKNCKAMLRVPKGKGELDVTCPRCKTVTVKKT